MTEAKKGPDTASIAHGRQARAAAICRDAYEGPLCIRERGAKYLPKFPREEQRAYEDRLSTSVFYDAFARTVKGLTGLIFSKPPRRSDDLPPELEPIWENIDLRGTHADVFLEQRHTDGEIDGHYVIFVDMQPRLAPGATLDDQRRAGPRPYWIGIRKQNVISAQFSEGARPQLVHFRYRETVVVPDGEYGEKEAERVREYNLAGDVVMFRVHEKQKGAGQTEDWVEIHRGEMDIDEIPVSAGYVGEKVAPFESKPPHLALALENVKHYQLTSDNDNCLHIASVPFPAFIGLQEDQELVVGPNNGVKLPPGGDVKMVEPAGNGLEAMEKRIQKSEQRMAILGLSMLMSESRAAETLGSKRIDKAEQDSELSGHARASEDAIEEALRLTAKWLGIEKKMPKSSPESRWVSLNRDFENLQLDAQMVTAIAGLVAEGRLTQETLWDLMIRGGVLPSTFDAEKEAELLEGAGMQPPADELAALRAELEEMRGAGGAGA